MGESRIENGTKALEEHIPITGSDFSVDITPSVTTYELYQVMTYTHHFALGEFVDNAITSAIQNWEALTGIEPSQSYQLKVDIRFDESQARLTIEDNAAGIRKEDIRRALTAGERPPDTTLLSVYGVGMKAAAFWFGRRLTVETYPLGDSNGYRAIVDLDQIRETQSAQVQVDIIQGRDRPGTKITIDKVSKDRWPRGRGLGKLRVLLASMYRIYLNHDEFGMNLLLDDHRLIFAQPPLLNEPFWPTTKGPESSDPILWEADFAFTTSRGHTIRGFVGLLERMSRDLSGLYLHYRGKGMGGIASGAFGDVNSGSDVRDGREFYKPALIFGQQGSYRDQRITGEFDVSELGKTSSTDSINWDLEEELEFLTALRDFLRRNEMNFWAQAENFQSRKAKALGDLSQESVEVALTDSAEQLADELSRVNAALEVSPPHHDDDSEVSSDTVLIPTVDFTSVAGELHIADDAGHVHKCRVEYVDDALFDLLSVKSESPEDHVIVMNLGHPYVRTFQWANPSVREAVRSLLLNLGLAEVLMSARVAPDAIRRKLNALANSAPINLESDIQR